MNPTHTPQDAERAAFDKANIRDHFGSVPTLRERDLMFKAWQAARASVPPAEPEKVRRNWTGIGELERTGYIPVGSAAEREAAPPTKDSPEQVAAPSSGEREALTKALTLMDRARDILTNGKPTAECNWGMLDTTELRALAAQSAPAAPVGFEQMRARTLLAYLWRKYDSAGTSMGRSHEAVVLEAAISLLGDPAADDMALLDADSGVFIGQTRDYLSAKMAQRLGFPAATPAPAAPVDSIDLSVSAMEQAIDTIDLVINQNREPGWSYRNTITNNRNIIRRECEKIRALLATPAPAAQAVPSEAEMVCYEAYQVVGSMLDDLGQFSTERATKILDNLSNARTVHDDVLPWPSFERPAPAQGAGMTDGQRMDWLAANCKESPLRPAAYGSAEFPDMRLKWEMPVLVSYNAIGAQIPLRECIDLAAAAQREQP